MPAARRSPILQAAVNSLRPLHLSLPLALLALVLGVVGGLARLGVVLPVQAPGPTVAWHGPLILFGFLGVLVSLERAVALRRTWAFAAPALSILGTGVLLAGHAGLASIAWSGAGAVAFAAVLGIERRSSSPANRCMLASCGAWVTGAALWGAGWSIGALLPWWAAFLVLMIVGERFQFGKLRWRRLAARTLAVLAAAVLVGAIVALVAPDLGMRVCGAAFAALAAWLLAIDLRQRARRPGLLWFVSVGLALGYAWLLVTGIIWLVLAPVLPGPAHDAAIHALFQGFVLGMVFAHAPMIFPAVTMLRLPFHRIQHVHLALLHGGLALRVGADLVGATQLARTGSTLTAIALALFVVTHAMSVRAPRSAGAAREREPATAASA
jgi:hypothetical protein